MDVQPSPTTWPTPPGLKRRHSPSLSLDLSDLPPLTTPSDPTNTLIITNLSDPLIFSPPNLQSIRDAISQHAPLHSFSPLRSFRRIIAVFPTAAAATDVRALLDGSSILNHRVRVYFGAATDLATKDRHLAAPQSQRLFFISPPPSPPMGWTMRNEDPPNRDVHADDLASALDRLNARSEARREADGEVLPSPVSGRRSRSSTLVFDAAHGRSGWDLPSIAVQDTSDVEDEADEGGKIMAHTARPPVELMEQ